jgi:hypothetical protein
MKRELDTCLPVSRLFWVSSLAYPNLLGTKGYVVVVVVKANEKGVRYILVNLMVSTFVLLSVC